MASNTKRNSSNFLVQGSILAMASIISRIIGLVYRIPFTNIVGDMGNDYYSTAFDIYNILLIISSYSLPLAVSKIVSAETSKGRRKNVYRILKCSLIFACISGATVGIILFAGAGAFASAMKTPFSIFAIRILAPSLLVVAVLGVLRGFFQGQGTMMPSAVSQILEQIVNAIVSIWAAYVLFSYGTKVGAVLGNQEQYQAAYGAAGGTLGTNLGAFVALLFSMFVLVVYLRVYKIKMRRDRGRNVDSYGYIFKVLLITIAPVLLSTTIYNCSALLDQYIFKNVATIQGYTRDQISTWNGIYTGKYKTLINVPISIASALAASSVPALSAAYANRKKEEVRSQINSAIRFIMIIAFPCAVGMGVLATPILQLCHFSDETGMAAMLLRIGSISIIFFSLSTLSNGLLQGISRMKEPVKNAAIALVLHIILLLVLMGVFRLNIYAVVISNAVFGLLMCLLNGISVRRYSGYRQEVVKTFLIPAISSATMGIAVFLLHKLLTAGANNIFSTNASGARIGGYFITVFCIIIAALIYMMLLLLLKGVEEGDILRFPGGTKMVVLFKKMHLLQ